MPLLLSLLPLLALLAGPALAQSPRLAPIESLRSAEVTVSGLSSGGFFAHQFHVAHSALVSGAGIIAGGPYACAEQVGRPPLLRTNPYASVFVALGVCTRMGRVSLPFIGELAEAPDAALSVRFAQGERADGTIDDPANLADDRVWLLSGTADRTVPQAGMRAVQAFYEAFGVRAIAADFSLAAGHGFPVKPFPGHDPIRRLACDQHDLPFVVDCGRDAAGELLAHLHGGTLAAPAAEAARERLTAFDQREFAPGADERASLAPTGHVYVPAACAAPGAPACRLHVAFHGCRQTTPLVGDDFTWDVGYNRWAEANAIVVLYPQIVAWQPGWDPSGLMSNPRGCWDWWGYTGADYHNQRGTQMRAVRAMIARLRGE